ncbi:MAG TPA: trypsin-like peptidase domain-containing protein [Kofleriaceae bacterium]|nr:trypsin-like peptidase domain-containing protein [Kofleriaceae bacterium]
MSRLLPTFVAVLAAVPPLAGAGAGTARADTVTVYLNRDGGNFTPGEPNDSRTNISSVPDRTVAVPAFGGSDQSWEDLVSCVDGLFAPFDIAVTDEDPGEDAHLEAVIGGDPTSFGLLPTVAGVSPFLSNCGIIDDSIVFIFPSVVGDDPRRLCETVAQEVAHSFGLDHQYLCEDPMTYLTGCGDKQFLFQESVCGEFEPRDCKCSRTQNSAQLLLDRVGRGSRPALWLAQPSTGDTVAAGFPVQAALTYAPDSLELFIDGVLIDDAEPDETGGAYQLVDLDTRDVVRAGTHALELVAHFGDEERSVNALVEVEGVDSEDVTGSGCSVGGGAGASGGMAAGALALLVVLGGRRGRRAVPAAPSRSASRFRRRTPPTPWVSLLVLALTAQAGCQSTVFGGPPDDIESSCQGAGDVTPAIGVLWSARGGTCTASLVNSDTLITAAHCVSESAAASEPIVVVLSGRQYIADRVDLHPDWVAGAPDDDLAVVTLTRVVENIPPLGISPEVPEFGASFTLVGHGEWSPDQVRGPERQAQAGSVADVQARSFSYQEEIADGCLGGRGGGPVVVSDAPGKLLGLHGEDRRIMRADQYACWLACGAGPNVADNLAGGCDCTRAEWRPCNACGAEFLDFTTATWSDCIPAADLRPCFSGATCNDAGYCQ